MHATSPMSSASESVSQPVPQSPPKTATRTASKAVRRISRPPSAVRATPRPKSSVGDVATDRGIPAASGMTATDSLVRFLASESAEMPLSLLKRLQCPIRDEAAWTMLFGLYESVVRGWVRVRGVQAADAPDVVQDVFRNVTRSIESFTPNPGQNSFRGWLYRISQNEANRYFRRRTVRPRGIGGTDACDLFQAVADPAAPDHVGDSLFIEGPQPSEPFEPDLDNMDVRVVRNALKMIRDEFTAETWKAFWLSTIDERPAAEIGALLKMSDGAVRQAKYRVLKRLRLLFDGLEKFDLDDCDDE